MKKNNMKMQYYSQDHQDEFLHKNVFKNLWDGYFVDVGSHDGVTINNTLFFEKNYKWTGINVEPIESVYSQLIINRPNCINLNCAVNNEDGFSEFILNKGYTEMISGLKSEFDPRHSNRLSQELSCYGGSTEIISVKTKRLETIFAENNVKHVNYLSIDVEGAEFEVIKSINFDKVFIDVIGFENNYKDQGLKVKNYLEEKGYVLLYESMDIFMIHTKSIFYVK